MGVPAYKMICNMDGHVKHAFFKKNATCEHEKSQSKKSCCAAPEKPVEKDDCCDFETALFQIDEPSQISHVSLKIADVYDILTFVFTTFYSLDFGIEFLVCSVSHAPPNVKLRQVALEQIGIFKI
jgi:hypothetical protein